MKIKKPIKKKSIMLFQGLKLRYLVKKIKCGTLKNENKLIKLKYLTIIITSLIFSMNV